MAISLQKPNHELPSYEPEHLMTEEESMLNFKHDSPAPNIKFETVEQVEIMPVPVQPAPAPVHHAEGTPTATPRKADGLATSIIKKKQFKSEIEQKVSCKKYYRINKDIVDTKGVTLERGLLVYFHNWYLDDDKLVLSVRSMTSGEYAKHFFFPEADITASLELPADKFDEYFVFDQKTTTTITASYTLCDNAMFSAPVFLVLSILTLACSPAAADIMRDWGNNFYHNLLMLVNITIAVSGVSMFTIIPGAIIHKRVFEMLQNEEASMLGIVEQVEVKKTDGQLSTANKGKRPGKEKTQELDSNKLYRVNKDIVADKGTILKRGMLVHFSDYWKHTGNNLSVSVYYATSDEYGKTPFQSKLFNGAYVTLPADKFNEYFVLDEKTAIADKVSDILCTGAACTATGFGECGLMMALIVIFHGTSTITSDSGAFVLFIITLILGAVSGLSAALGLIIHKRVFDFLENIENEIAGTDTDAPCLPASGNSISIPSTPN